MKTRIAVFAAPGDSLEGFTAIWTDIMEGATNRVRRTEYVEVDFPELSREQTVGKELDALAAMEKEVREEMTAKLAVILAQRAKLLAITDAREVA